MKKQWKIRLMFLLIMANTVPAFAADAEEERTIKAEILADTAISEVTDDTTSMADTYVEDVDVENDADAEEDMDINGGTDRMTDTKEPEIADETVNEEESSGELSEKESETVSRTESHQTDGKTEVSDTKSADGTEITEDSDFWDDLGFFFMKDVHITCEKVFLEEETPFAILDFDSDTVTAVFVDDVLIQEGTALHHVKVPVTLNQENSIGLTVDYQGVSFEIIYVIVPVLEDADIKENSAGNGLHASGNSGEKKPSGRTYPTSVSSTSTDVIVEYLYDTAAEEADTKMHAPAGQKTVKSQQIPAKSVKKTASDRQAAAEQVSVRFYGTKTSVGGTSAVKEVKRFSGLSFIFRKMKIYVEAVRHLMVPKEFVFRMKAQKVVLPDFSGQISGIRDGAGQWKNVMAFLLRGKDVEL